jgi:type IV fimbrial biogenesis protein FimT
MVATMPRGFTIMEIMVVVAIVAIFAAVAAPSMSEMIVASRVRGASSDFYGALVAARSEAIKRRTSTTVEPTSTYWKTGWKVKVGSNVFQTAEALPDTITVLPSAAATTITYSMNGRVTSGAQTLVFYVATVNTIKARCVSIEANGMPRVRMDSNGDASDGCN